MKLIVLLVFVTAVTVGAQELACTPPTGTILWDSNFADIVHEVVWDITSAVYTQCDECNATDDSLPVQLPTVEMEQGSQLRFIPDNNNSVQFAINPVLVDELGFRSCNTSRGTLLLSVGSNDTFLVDASFLSPGTHYFVEDTQGTSAIDDCHMGLRVKVVVKPNTCGSEVTSTACSGRGLCATYGGEPTYHCLCCGTYEGDVCQDLNPCLSNPCGKNGQCVHSGDGSADFTCECSVEYYGEFCEKKRENLCDVIKCLNGGTCTGNSTVFDCACPPGLTGSHCEVDINDCDPSPCVHGACIDKLNDFECHCKPGFHGKTCSEQKKECSLSPCKNGGYCEDLTTDPTNYHFKCHCLPGWTGRNCSNKVDPCQPNPCHSGHCVADTHKGYRCNCHSGYTGSRCEIDIDNCSPNPCLNSGHCKDGVDTHTCICINSHMGVNCQRSMDFFFPILEGMDTSLDPETREEAMYIVVATLAVAVAIVLGLMLVYYCRNRPATRDACQRPCCWSFVTWLRYRKHRDSSLTLGVDATSGSNFSLAGDTMQPGYGRGDYCQSNAGFESQEV